MVSHEKFETTVPDMWHVLRLNRTAAFGNIRVLLQPVDRAVGLQLTFPNADNIVVTLPPEHRTKNNTEQYYRDVFAKISLVSYELKENPYTNSITAVLPRQDVDIEEKIIDLYRSLFGAIDTDKVKITTDGLASDISTLQRIYILSARVNSRETFKSASTRYEGRSARSVQIGRLLRAANILLFPIVVIQSYNLFGVPGLCGAVILFCSFFWIYRVILRRMPVRENWGGPLYVGLSAATLLTKDPSYLLFIPTIAGLIWASLSAGLALNIIQPASKSERDLKGKGRRQYRLYAILWTLSGIALFFMGEWARRNLSFDSWVTFFAFVRFEMLLPMLVIGLPIILIFLKLEADRDAQEGTTETPQSD